MQLRNPIKSVNINDTTVEYHLPKWARQNYVEINYLFLNNGITTPTIINESSTAITVERIHCSDWFTANLDMISQPVDQLLKKINTAGTVDRYFDEKYIDTRAPKFKFKDKILTGDYVLSHMDMSSMNLFTNNCIIDFEDAVMAPLEYDLVYRFFNPYTLRNVNLFDDYCIRYCLNLEKSLYIQLYICEMIFHFVEYLGYYRPSIPQTKVYYDYVNKRLADYR